MKRKRMEPSLVWTGLVALVGGMACTGGLAEAQVVVGGRLACPDSVAQGDLGISGLDCRGDCTLTINERGEEQSWSFSVEPEIIGVTAGGPAEGLLRVGDLIVAIDGVPITTWEGGQKYASVAPGQEVDLLVRREGRLERVEIEAGRVCPTPPPTLLSPAPLVPREGMAVRDTVPPPPPQGVTVGRLPPPPRPDTVWSRGRSIGVAVAPRVVVARSLDSATATVIDAKALPSPPARPGIGIQARPLRSARTLLDPAPRGRLGIGFQCSHCGTRTDENTGEDLWFFSGPIEVTAVHAGGAADEAGIQIGDLIMAIDGHPVETEEGGRAFSGIEVGKAVRLTLVKRSGREAEVRMIPQESRLQSGLRGIVSGEPLREVAAEPALPPHPARVEAPDTVVAPTEEAELVPFTLSFNPPSGWPLRYSGTVEGVEVEVRGEPANIAGKREDRTRAVRTLIIQGQGLWIRIRVPAGGRTPEK